MNEAQMQFLSLIADRIPRLFAALQEGNQRSEFVLGNRIIAGRQVRLVLLAEVIDPGHNPLATHSSHVKTASVQHYFAAGDQQNSDPDQD